MSYPTSFLKYCTTMDLKFTSLRKCVLFILWQTEKPLKAYEILSNLLKMKENSSPPTVYRVLDYFLEQGVIHKIESIQSYTLCHEPKKHNPSELLMVCNLCHQVNEIYDDHMHELIQKLAEKNRFQLGKEAIELKGVCDQCLH